MTERRLAPQGLARWGLRTIAKLRSNSRFVNPMGCARYISKKNRTGWLNQHNHCFLGGTQHRKRFDHCVPAGYRGHLRRRQFSVVDRVMNPRINIQQTDLKTGWKKNLGLETQPCKRTLNIFFNIQFFWGTIHFPYYLWYVPSFFRDFHSWYLFKVQKSPVGILGRWRCSLGTSGILPTINGDLMVIYGDLMVI